VRAVILTQPFRGIDDVARLQELLRLSYTPTELEQLAAVDIGTPALREKTELYTSVTKLLAALEDLPGCVN
jgi:hypothetical protein